MSYFCEYTLYQCEKLYEYTLVIISTTNCYIQLRIPIYLYLLYLHINIHIPTIPIYTVSKHSSQFCKNNKIIKAAYQSN